MTVNIASIPVSCQLVIPSRDHLYEHIRANAGAATRMAVQNSHTGKRVAICGAGVSLVDLCTEIPADMDEVWGCNSALNYLVSRGCRVTHGFAIDAGVEMVTEWQETFDVEYLLASSVDPRLVHHLRAAGRPCRFFHSYLGLDNPPDWTQDGSYEMSLYTTIYPTSVQVGHGLNAVPRAVCLAIAMGFSEIRVYGADCACAPDQPAMPYLGTPEYAQWMQHIRLYADGRTASVYGVDAVMAEAVIDGRRWHTRPDMAISATMLLDLVKAYPHVELLGDTLPNAIAPKDDAWMTGMPRLVGPGDVQHFGAHVPPLSLELV